MFSPSFTGRNYFPTDLHDENPTRNMGVHVRTGIRWQAHVPRRGVALVIRLRPSWLTTDIDMALRLRPLLPSRLD